MDASFKNTAKKKKSVIFFLIGLQPTVIESQVIHTCLDLIRKGLDVEIWSLCTSAESMYEAKNQILKWEGYSLDFKVFRGFRSGIMFSEIFNAIIVSLILIRRKYRPEFFHCRTEYPTVIGLIIKSFFSFRVIWDSRGDTVSEFKLYKDDLPSWKWIFFSYGLFLITLRIKFARRFSDNCIFVSESLRNLYYPGIKKKGIIIPCAADRNYFYFDPELRQEIRRSLGITDDETVLVYSGSMALWQCVDETVELIEEAFDGNFANKAIILTPETKQFLEKFSLRNRDRIICKSVTISEVNNYLNAADYGIFLRKRNNVNKVASPVKFAEYCLAGLPVIMTDAIDQANYYASMVGNGINYQFGRKFTLNLKFTAEQREYFSLHATGILSREAVSSELEKIYFN